ncbi:MAG: sigma-70 family RNA polymerase sigma factor [Planctomycetaceae bacterium]|nr:sigma-70 family RNA polymerase sigma factor [Planctomycetaceae bacterium]
MPQFDDSAGGSSRRFQTTCWSLVLAAGQQASDEAADRALATLCATYWKPVYAYVRGRIRNVEDARDLTQEFFASVLERGTLRRADPARGRFRTFLLTTCQRFLANAVRDQSRQKRGGRCRTFSLMIDRADFDQIDRCADPQGVDEQTAERIFEREWVLTLLESVLQLIRSEFEAKGKRELFEALKSHLSEGSADTFAELGQMLGMRENAVRVACHRMRTRYRELIRAEIAATVDSPGMVDDEIRRLFAVVGGSSGNSV